MINRLFRLVSSRRIEIVEREIELQGSQLLIRPEYLSICAADQRYYWGKRKKEILNQKLPMALIHEGIGTVLYDPTGKVKSGTKVVMIPNVPDEAAAPEVKENYGLHSSFCSSNKDGFMQDFVQLPKERVIVLPSEDKVYVLSELLSVAYNAVNSMQDMKDGKGKKIGIWGDGNVGYVTALALRYLYPEAEVYVFGKHRKKLQYFSFVTETYLIDEIPEKLLLHQSYECVGGDGNKDAIEQIIAHMYPQGEIALMGVNEDPVPINTRVILEKGLRLVGNSRSSKEDFEQAIALIMENANARAYLTNMISKVVTVRTEEDIYEAFEEDSMNDFKTIMEWRV